MSTDKLPEPVAVDRADEYATIKARYWCQHEGVTETMVIEARNKLNAALTPAGAGDMAVYQAIANNYAKGPMPGQMPEPAFKGGSWCAPPEGAYSYAQLRVAIAAEWEKVTKLSVSLHHVVAGLEAAEEECDALRGEVESLRADAERYRWLRARLPGSAYRIAGVIYSEGGTGVDSAIDAAKGQA